MSRAGTFLHTALIMDLFQRSRLAGSSSSSSSAWTTAMPWELSTGECAVLQALPVCLNRKPGPEYQILLQRHQAGECSSRRNPHSAENHRLWVCKDQRGQQLHVSRGHPWLCWYVCSCPLPLSAWTWWSACVPLGFLVSASSCCLLCAECNVSSSIAPRPGHRARFSVSAPEAC